MRYDFLITIPAMVLRRSVFAKVGLPDLRWASGSDFHFLASLCRKCRANYIAVPTYIKHEFSSDGKLPTTGHVVTGKSAMRFANEWQAAWDDLFWNQRNPDSQLRGLRSLRQYWTAQTALKAGLRQETLENLNQARRGLPGFWRANALYWLVRSLPGIKLPQRACAAACSAGRLLGRARRLLVS
jgi:hypothetical protein